MKKQHVSRRRLLAATMVGASGLLGESVLPAQEREAEQASSKSFVDPRIRGPFLIMTTPFTESGDVDFDVLAKEARFINWCGCSGMVWPQSGDNVDLLSRDEKFQGMEVLAEATRGFHAALCLGVQGKDTAEMLEFAKHAEKLAPAAFVSRPPELGKTEDDLRQYWRALASVANRPVIIQTTGGLTYQGPAPSAELLVELAEEFPHFGYVKEEANPIISRMRDLFAARPRIRRVFSANGGFGWLYESRLGTEGVITERAIFADLFARIWELQQSDRDSAALRDAYSQFLLMADTTEILPGGRFGAAQAYLWKKRGIFNTMVSRSYGPGNSRPASPLLTEWKLKDDEIAEVEYCYEALKPYLKEGNPFSEPHAGRRVSGVPKMHAGHLTGKRLQ